MIRSVSHRDPLRNTSEVMLGRARELRRRMTPSERRFWKLVRRNWQHFHWRSQHPVGNFILDFFCFSLRLAIELDGSVHAEQEAYDQWRDAELAKLGIRVVRIGNREFADPLSEAFPRIWAAIEEQIVLLGDPRSDREQRSPCQGEPSEWSEL